MMGEVFRKAHVFGAVDVGVAIENIPNVRAIPAAVKQATANYMRHSPQVPGFSGTNYRRSTRVTTQELAEQLPTVMRTLFEPLLLELTQGRWDPLQDTVA